MLSVTDHGERRNVALRSRRDAIAAWFEVHPGQLAALPEDVVVCMAERLDVEGSAHGQLAELRSTVQRWEGLARTDALTGQANRRAAEERLEREAERASRYGRPLTLLLADLDGLKTVNDRHGHPAGDTVLRVLAQRLCDVVRGTDMLARWGGDEFVMICPETDETAAAQVAERLVCAANEPVELGDALVVCGISVGWATDSADVDPRRLLRAADQALYRSKQAGRGRATGATG
jgi:diguanylate cyclase (GGDEF)-like protein